MRTRCANNKPLRRKSLSTHAMTPRLQAALDEGYLGLYPAGNFYLGRGDATDARSLRHALFYFADETIAIPRAGMAVAGFARGIAARDDVARWAAQQPLGEALQYPPLIWVGSPAIARGARFSTDGHRIAIGDIDIAFDVVPKIALNRSYYDASSIAFFSQRTVSTRGILRDASFTARTLWPEDFLLDAGAQADPLDGTVEAVRSRVRADRGGVASEFVTRLLWERSPGACSRWTDKPVLAAMLNGAQGDDDEAHAGHLALITGRVAHGGAIGDWLANNFYALDTFSEKGIIAAPVPLDCYLADLNSGQSWYRPTYIIAAVLNSPRVAARVQSALCRVYNQLYRHQLEYRHATMNCAAISIDALRALGWRVASRGASSRAFAFASFPVVAARERSWTKAMQAADYLSEDRTRLLPAAAFEEIAADMLQMAQGRLERPPTAFEAAFACDVDALVSLRIPQIPSSRPLGDFPVVTTREYRARLPADPADLQIVPVPPRPFPAALRDDDLRDAPLRPGQVVAIAWAALSLAAVTWLVRQLFRSAKGARPRSERRE
jgi:hypothetical protein